MKTSEIKKVIDIINDNGICVIPTDTIYGIVGSAFSKKTVEKIYHLRNRGLKKPMIILISSLNDLNQFNIKLTESQKKFLEKNWPNPLSIIFNCPDSKFEYLHRNTKSLAFRFPKLKWLQELIKHTGPLVAPSANLSSSKPSETIDEAIGYFGDQVNFYLDGGKIISDPSTLIKLNGRNVQILREGKYKLNEQ